MAIQVANDLCGSGTWTDQAPERASPAELAARWNAPRVEEDPSVELTPRKLEHPVLVEGGQS